MTDRTHPDSGRIITSGDVINDLHDEIAQLRGTRKVLWNLLGECLPVIDALMQIPGDDDSDARLNCLAGRINDVRITELESQLAQRFDAADMATAAQQGIAYAALPTSSYAGRVHEEGFLVGTCPLYTADQMHAFADATHTLRASHGQAPAQHTGPCVVCGSDEPFTGTCGSRDPRALCKQPTTTAQAADSVAAPAPPPECETEAEKRAFAFGWFKALESERMKADSVQEDAARYRFLRDGEWRDTDLEPFIRLQLNTLWDAKIDAAMNKGGAA